MSINADVHTQGQGVEALIESAGRVAGAMQRQDLAARLKLSRNRVARPDTVIAVVGEFKRGKSSLVNGLLGLQICPVDDDIATATVTVLRHGNGPAIAWRNREGTRVREEIDSENLPALLTARGHGTQDGQVDLVEIQLENALLARGLTLVDTPGVGSLALGTSAATIGYLHVADALLFVTDASAPVSAAEIEFLRAAAEICPAVLVVVTKTDLYPEWSHVLDNDAATFDEMGGIMHISPVSSVLRNLAFERRDASLNEESGYPYLLDAVASHVLAPAKSRATARALADVSVAVEQLRSALLTEEQALLDPSNTATQVEKLRAEGERLERLRNWGGRWSTLMNDEFADLVASVDHRFRQAIRRANRYADEAIEASDPGETWDEIADETRRRMAEAAVRVVRELEAGADAITIQIVEVLQEDGIRLDAALGRATPVAVGNLWTAQPPEVRFLMEHAATGWASLRGAQGGILVIGMLGGLAGVVLSTGMLVGIGALFGGKQLFEERKRQVTTRRQKARTTIRQFLDDVQFEVAKSMRDLSRELQRQLRDHFSQRIGEVVRSCATTADALQKALQRDEGERTRRIAEVRSELATLARIQDQRDELLRESAL